MKSQKIKGNVELNKRFRIKNDQVKYYQGQNKKKCIYCNRECRIWEKCVSIVYYIKKLMINKKKHLFIFYQLLIHQASHYGLLNAKKKLYLVKHL